MTNLIPVKECIGRSHEEIQEQIDLRRQLIAQMVGSLYPRIVADEITALLRILVGNK